MAINVETLKNTQPIWMSKLEFYSQYLMNLGQKGGRVIVLLCFITILDFVNKFTETFRYICCLTSTYGYQVFDQ